MYTRLASLHRYTYAENNPVLYTDPSGQCVSGAMVDTIACGVVAGAVIRAGVNLGYQVWGQGKSLNCVDWGEVLISGGGGAVAGAVGVIGFGAGAAVLGTGFWGTVGAGAFSGFLAGQYGRLAQAALSGNFWNMQLGKDFLNPATHAFFLNDGRVQNIIEEFFHEDENGNNRTFDDEPRWWNDISGSIRKA